MYEVTPPSSNSTFFSNPDYFNPNGHHNQHHQQQQSFNVNRFSRSFYNPNLSLSLNGMVTTTGVSNANDLITATTEPTDNNNTDKLLEGYNMGSYKQLLVAN